MTNHCSSAEPCAMHLRPGQPTLPTTPAPCASYRAQYLAQTEREKQLAEGNVALQEAAEDARHHADMHAFEESAEHAMDSGRTCCGPAAEAAKKARVYEVGVPAGIGSRGIGRRS